MIGLVCEWVQVLIDLFGDDVRCPEHVDVIDEAFVVDVSDTKRLGVWVDNGGGEEDECAGHEKSSMKRPPTASLLGEAQEAEVRQVDRFEIDAVLSERLYEDTKDPALLEPVGAAQRFVAEDDV